MKTYETVIGLEVHVELSTASKIFCSCSTAFGAAPNTQVCEVCAGMPGTLPVLNRQVVEFAIRAGLATHCDISRFTRFDRKNYFYPDLPKAYQISQLYLPICREGWLEIAAGDGSGEERKRVGIHEIHMEEDAGKLVHDPWDDATLVDYNRCGVPLLEIVSDPDFRTPEEVLDYLTRLRAILMFAGVSDCRMQEGSLRADVNVSVRPVGSDVLGTRTEMKNMNSFKAISRAIAYESRRQIEVLEEGGRIVQETRRWDENKDASFAMRSKENANDYMYFPEPDLPPVHVDEVWLARARAEMPELPESLRTRYVEDFGLSAYDAGLLTEAPATARLFDYTTSRTGQPKEVANWILGDFRKMHNEAGIAADEASIDPDALVAVIRMVADGRVTRDAARAAFRAAYLDGADPDAYIREHGLEILRDDGALRAIAEKVIATHTGPVSDFRAGKEKALQFLIGQCMRELRGRADAQAVADMLRTLLGETAE